MNRRSVLAGTAVGTTLLLAGCLDRIQLSTPVLVNVENETDAERSVTITAYDLADERETYDEAVMAPTNATTTLGRLSNSDQQVRVELHEPASATGGEPDPDAAVEDVAETLIGESTQGLTIYITDDGLEIDQRYRK